LIFLRSLDTSCIINEDLSIDWILYCPVSILCVYIDSMKNLVIVESPTKARTISRYLGNDYEIKFSMGHILDLPKSKLGVDIEKDFKPELDVIEDKKKIIADLKKAAKGAPLIILATDPDREGEAISANIQEVLSSAKGITKDKFKRVVFHEITKNAILDAFNHPRKVDHNLVNAQTARRILDRLVGYQLSPVLWQKIRRGLSAGRVQSVALRLIVEREREIEKFKKENYFTIHILFSKEKEGKTPIPFELIEIDGEKIEIQDSHALYDGDYKISKTVLDTEQKAKDIVEKIKKKHFKVADILQKESRRSPYAPFTTSTLQQEASRRFGYSGKRTMSFAQKLYEEGFITYHRTDSVTLSSTAVDQIREYVKKEYGDKYVSSEKRVYTAKQKSAQEAHEGIRPTEFNAPGSGQFEEVIKTLGRESLKIYEIIWRRAVASQMADAKIESTTVFADSVGDGTKLRAKTNGSVMLFEGFLKVNSQALQDTKLPQYAKDETLITEQVTPEIHETPPPPRYNDASLISTLEEKGIGRPSTYASIISTIVDRGYIERVERRFVPTAVAKAVNDFLVEYFSDIDDIPFTSEMEDSLDAVASGEKEWVTMMKDFYRPFEKQLKEVKGAARVKIETEKTDEPCPECKKGMLVVRSGKFGKFLSCDRFPDCKFTKPFVEETNIACPKDSGKVIVRKTKTGRKFYGCSNYPNCDFAAWKLEDIKGISKKAVDQEKERIGEKAEGSVSPSQEATSQA